MKSFIAKSAAFNAESAAFCPKNIFDEQTIKIINGIAHQLINNKCFPPHMEDDVALRLALVVHAEASKYLSEKCGFHDFVRTVLTRRAKNIIRDWKRNNIEFVSIDLEVDEDGTIMSDTISDDYYQMTCGNRVRHEIERRELIESEKYAIERLSPKYQKICREILAGASISDLASRYGMCRSGFRKKYLLPIRKVFVEAGLADFCKGGF